ncbi:cysteine desulfurase [Fusarium solani]|uniref:Cysteine desulfurase n=1 Tax=Fusarium solani TaxID=169388 RepID=A0A9P9JRS8_FUSSL|nr:cysteine desulfurase [Fusarium solani]KAH7230831.1 cysteine desulfurase [Fusarium solani]
MGVNTEAESFPALFPALAQDQIFSDHAAGSQVVASCIESISHYMSNKNVQLGFAYPLSEQATSRFDNAFEATTHYMNASTAEIVFGYSIAHIVRIVSIALKFQPDDEIVLSKLDHESHISPSVQTAKWKGLEVRWWVPSRNIRTDPKLEADDLKAQGLVNEKTRIVCSTHVSNVLGSATDVATMSRAMKSINPNELVGVDGVAYGPHAPVDVRAFGVDLYYFSWYKVSGPHLVTGFVNKSAFQQLEYLGSDSSPKEQARYILGLTSGSYEAIQSISAVINYVDRAGGNWIEKQEVDWQKELLRWVRSRSDIQLYGDASSDRSARVPLISFRVPGRSSADVVGQIWAKSKCRPTVENYWARRLLEDVLRVDVDDGVIRSSFVHYNTIDEVQNLLRAL